LSASVSSVHRFRQSNPLCTASSPLDKRLEFNEIALAGSDDEATDKGDPTSLPGISGCGVEKKAVSASWGGLAGQNAPTAQSQISSGRTASGYDRGRTSVGGGMAEERKDGRTED
ncbi:hypothetical protein E4U60_006981, partial [Claviceps pazoutovae]